MLAGIDSFRGYGQVAIAFASGLEAAGVNVKIRATSLQERFGAIVSNDIRKHIVCGPQPEPWELIIHPPNLVPTKGKKTAMFTMNESTRLNPVSVHLLNQAEVVIVPSQFCANTFSASGVNVPIRVVQLGIDPAIFSRRAFPDNSPFVFGTAGRMAGGGLRKDLDRIAETFLEAFTWPVENEARLKIKCHPDCPVKDWRDPRIEITREHLSAEKLADWFASLHCFVSASKGEGFGLMQLQALACGRPLVSPDFGGVSEFFDWDCGLVMPYELETAPLPYHGHWAGVKKEDLSISMKGAWAFRDHLQDIGKDCAARAGQFTWKRASEKLVAVLREFGALKSAQG